MVKKRKFIFLFISVFVILSVVVFKSPYKLPYLGFYDKVYPHRVNSLERLESALIYYDGLELDLVYHEKEDYLDVNHPPAESINLSLDTYFKNITRAKKPFLWLDIKNLKVANADAIYNKLEQLVTLYNYPKSFILIETRDPEALHKFTKEGYKTSYYLPSGLYRLSQNNLEIELKNIANVLMQKPQIGISTSYKDYNIIAKHFPNKTKYIWALTSSYSPNTLKVRQILKDKQVKIVLTKFRTNKGYR